METEILQGFKERYSKCLDKYPVSNVNNMEQFLEYLECIIEDLEDLHNEGVKSNSSPLPSNLIGMEEQVSSPEVSSPLESYSPEVSSPLEAYSPDIEEVMEKKIINSEAMVIHTASPNRVIHDGLAQEEEFYKFMLKNYPLLDTSRVGQTASNSGDIHSIDTKNRIYYIIEIKNKKHINQYEIQTFLDSVENFKYLDFNTVGIFISFVDNIPGVTSDFFMDKKYIFMTNPYVKKEIFDIIFNYMFINIRLATSHKIDNEDLQRKINFIVDDYSYINKNLNELDKIIKNNLDSNSSLNIMKLNLLLKADVIRVIIGDLPLVEVNQVSNDDKIKKYLEIKRTKTTKKEMLQALPECSNILKQLTMDEIFKRYLR